MGCPNEVDILQDFKLTEEKLKHHTVLKLPYSLCLMQSIKKLTP